MRQLEHSQPELLGHGQRPLGGQPGQDDRPLLAAVAGHQLSRAPMGLGHRLRHRAKARVARRVAEPVVVGLEGVHVEEDEGEGDAHAVGAAPLFVEGRSKVRRFAMPVSPSSRGQLRELGVGGLDLGRAQRHVRSSSTFCRSKPSHAEAMEEWADQGEGEHAQAPEPIVS